MSIWLPNATIGPNVRRYVQLPQHRGGACFCTRGAVQELSRYYIILALAKTVTPAGAPGGAGAARTASHKTILFSQKILAVRRGNCIYRPVGDCCDGGVSRGAVMVFLLLLLMRFTYKFYNTRYYPLSGGPMSRVT